MVNKISIVGAGKVGESTAQMLAIQKLAQQIVLIDLDEQYAKGVALDIQETSPVYHFDAELIGSSDIANIKDSNIVIITAGLPRKPGMDRTDVLAINLKIIDEIMDGIIKHAPDAYVIVVSNPVDVLTYYANKKANWPRNRIMGQAGILDSMRLSSFIAMETDYSINDIQAMVLGGHGDTMVPLPRFTTVSGISIEHLLDQNTIDNLIQRTRDGGAEILNLKQKSSANNAPGAAVTIMVEAIVHNKHRLLPCITMLEGEYGQSDIAIGVPVMLGENGVEKIIELNFTDEEQQAFDTSAQVIKSLINEI
ncbi:MAG TPA: malate dehydrogenase [Gammaproteobacteria bacterium]|jgi:malate dehydrogenase|nr:malate dehydrogenase [Gammaproteobacteria bacterium]HAE04237.1 malate dehydrogenase [Gammaproteobacteria bacterium]HAE70622.1 malate dehydrogenase [Gammaproteobacteria bacterium]HAE73429.1 malate dehydrogenase [Gammaproteobacteria bacterium]HAO38185.1 malate dehydrogenase [Gammaproteobacteria bacterium]